MEVTNTVQQRVVIHCWQKVLDSTRQRRVTYFVSADKFISSVHLITQKCVQSLLAHSVQWQVLSFTGVSLWTRWQFWRQSQDSPDLRGPPSYHHVVRGKLSNICHNQVTELKRSSMRIIKKTQLIKMQPYAVVTTRKNTKLNYNKFKNTTWSKIGSLSAGWSGFDFCEAQISSLATTCLYYL